MIITREQCRRLSLPTIISILTTIGPLYKILKFQDYVSIGLLSRGEPLFLKFSDEDTAFDEKCAIGDGPGVPGEVPLCAGVKCDYGCGCGCMRDLAYVEDTIYLPASLPTNTCRTEHYRSPISIRDPQIFNLRLTKKMANGLVAAYLEAAISAIIAK